MPTYQLDRVMISNFQSTQTSHVADSFDFKAADDGGTEVSLLVPAVQAAREAADRSGDHAGADDFMAEEDADAVMVGMLLPAVQECREAARSDSSTAADDVIVDGNIITAENYDSMF